MKADVLDLHIERAVAGGRMLARHGGIVVLVAGAIPGERVSARVERSTRSLIWARTVDVLESGPARRTAGADPLCGGMDYAHIVYADQLRFKAEILADAFKRVGKLSIDAPVSVEPSPEDGYRLRARLHVQNGRAGFFREGRHELCDPGPTRQLVPDALAAIESTLSSFGDATRSLSAVVVSENVAATQRVLHLERDQSSRAPLRISKPDARLTGLTTAVDGQVRALVGADRVIDSAVDLFGPEPPIPVEAQWVRRPTSFFQGNRFLTGTLVRHVLSLTGADRVADLYAGVGLFTVAFGARGCHVIAVEGDRSSGDDLRMNAEPWSRHVEVIRASVEDAVPRLSAGAFDTVVVDPPRTGVSPAALAAITRLDATRIVYVSCDPATLARDAGKLVPAGYRLESIRAFDLFPNTSHVETVVAFAR